MTTIKPGTIVKDKEARENFGLQMKVVDEASHDVKVSYVNLDGLCQEGWVNKDRLQIVATDEDLRLPLNPAFY
jgi:hypothetical protein